MAQSLSLLISTPLEIVVQAEGIVSFRADDESGGFGILPGHVDLLTVTPASVVRWKTGSEDWRYCAVQGAVLTVRNGCEIHIACRAGILGDDLHALERGVQEARTAEKEEASAARVAEAKLHAKAIRQIMSHLVETSGLGGASNG